MAQVIVTHRDGTEWLCDSLDDALEALRAKYGDEIEIEIETEGYLCEGRVLVWENAADAENDPGAPCAAIYPDEDDAR